MASFDSKLAELDLWDSQSAASQSHSHTSTSTTQQNVGAEQAVASSASGVSLATQQHQQMLLQQIQQQQHQLQQQSQMLSQMPAASLKAPLPTQDRVLASNISHLCQALESAKGQRDKKQTQQVWDKLDEMGVVVSLEQSKWMTPKGLSGTWRQPGSPKRKVSKKQAAAAKGSGTTLMFPTPPESVTGSVTSRSSDTTTIPPLSSLMPSMVPSFLSQLYDSSVKTLLFMGCGGGYDFVLSMLLYKELTEMGKEIIILSNSFSECGNQAEGTPVYSDDQGCQVRKIYANTKTKASKLYEYAPERHIAHFLDTEIPDKAPHYIYASNAKRWCMGGQKCFLNQLAAQHNIDAVVTFDFGTDSIMRGDEYMVGDPIEDAISVGAAASLPPNVLKFLIVTGLGVDRQSGISDASTLRGIAELQRLGGCRGSVGVEAGSSSYKFYQSAMKFLDRTPPGPGYYYPAAESTVPGQAADTASGISSRSRLHRSNVVGALCCATEGGYGYLESSFETTPDQKLAQCFLTPLMSTLWAFDTSVVASRCLITQWIEHSTVASQKSDVAFQRHQLRERQILQQPEALPGASSS